MSNILSYNDKTVKPNGEDWVQTEPYTDDDIARIHDPNGGLAEYPRTAIPSPFAQLDLVKNAFAKMSNQHLQSSLMDMRLVSNALDVAQLFFNFESHKDYLRIVRWNRSEQIANLLANSAHQLYGETLNLFLGVDTAYNFHLLDDWYIIMMHDKVVGATSPASLVMSAPGAETFPEIKVEQGVSLFSDLRQLWQRDEDFVLYMFLLFNAFPVLRERVPDVYAYMSANLPVIRRERPALYQSIIAALPNPAALDVNAASALVTKLDTLFDPFPADCGVTCLGARFYRRRSEDISGDAAQSDFLISPTREVGDTLPLVLRSGFNGSADGYKYINHTWDSSTEVLAADVPVDERLLPETNIKYPFLTTSDFLLPDLIQLSGAIDTAYYFGGNMRSHSTGRKNGYLLPLSATYFKYFNVSDLTGQVNGKNVFEMEENSDGSVLVTLRIPVKKRHIELTRTYHRVRNDAWSFDEQRGTGRIISGVALSASIFPFVRTSSHDSYTVQQFSMKPATDVTLRFLANGMSAKDLRVESKARTTGAVTSLYYDIDASFDLIEASVTTPAGSFCGIIVPMWKPFTPSNKELIFAVDFGTTNSHIEWAERGKASQTLSMSTSAGHALVASLLREGELDIADNMLKVEFVPRAIDDLYGFPLRSALASNSIGNDGTRLFANVNIPFLYERKDFTGYDVTTNLKWMGDITLSQEFLREMVLLIRAKTLIENANPANVTILYFYPVSMGGSDRRRLNDAWTTLFETYIGNPDEHLHMYPESIAPAFFYSGAQVAGSSYVSIDIGGGTSDVVVYQPTPDRLKSEPVIVSSFRFAGNALFGDGFAANDAAHNPLLSHYTEYFERLIDKNDDIAYLNRILADVMKTLNSADINAFLFSIENVAEIRAMREIDRKLFSYNALLRNDNERKFIFLYFYAAIIYYVASMMKSRNLMMPKQLYFSGTGSKILNILGSMQQITEFSQNIIEKVFGEKYTENFEIKIERNAPKQITCRGGVKLENTRLDGGENTDAYSPRNINRIKYCHSMTDEQSLTFATVNDLAVRSKIVAAVEDFNAFFLSLCDAELRDEHGIDNNVMRAYAEVLNRDLQNYLTSGINSYLKGRYDLTDTVEDVPFFYPIIGVIRHNLLPITKSE